MQQHGSNFFGCRPDPLPLGGGGQEVKIQLFSEHGHVAYQIKWNHDCSNMQAHILSLHTPSTPGVGSKVKHFLKGMEHRAPCKHILCPYTHPQLVGLIKRYKNLNVVKLHIN